MIKHLVKIAMYGIGLYVGFTIGDLYGFRERSSSAFAADGDLQVISDTEISFAANLQLVVRLVYLLMWPLVAIAGATLDNSLVLGEVFYLNVSIRKMRQIMRNFANFALGGIFLFALLRNIFVAMSGGEYLTGNRGIKSLLPKMLLAAVLIQSSFFVMSTLIDLSTVAIYSVGTMPVNAVMSDVQRNAQGEGAKGGLDTVRFLKPDIKYSLDNTKAREGTNSTFNIFYGCPANSQINYIPCVFYSNQVPEFGNTDGTDPKTWNQHKMTQAKSWAALTNSQDVTGIFNSISNEYCVYQNSLINLRDPTRIIPGDPPGNPADKTVYLRGRSVDYCEVAYRREDVIKAQGQGIMAQQNCPTLGNFMNSAAGMTGPMYGLYASILRMDQIAQTPNHMDVVEISLQFLVKLLVAIALIIPLLALCVALMMRLVALWGFIVFSPLLVVAWVFFKDKTESSGGGKMSIGSLIGLIFMPVVVVFAVSISLIFLTLIGRADELNVVTGPDRGPTSSIGAQYEPGSECNKATGEIKCPNPGERNKCGNINNHCYDLAGITSLCFTETQTSIGNTILNIFSYLFVNMFGIALMWMIIFAALGSSKITKGVTDKIAQFGKDIAKMAPIPVAGGLSYNDISNTAGALAATPNKMVQNQAGKFDDYMSKMNALRSDGKKNLDKQFNSATTAQDASKALKTELANNTSIYDYKGAGTALGLASGTGADSLKDVASTTEGWNWMRKEFGGEAQDISKISNSLNKITGAQRKAAVNADIHKDLADGLKTRALNKDGITDIGSGSFYDTGNKEFITITDNAIDVLKTDPTGEMTEKKLNQLNNLLTTMSISQKQNILGNSDNQWIKKIDELRTQTRTADSVVIDAKGAIVNDGSSEIKLEDIANNQMKIEFSGTSISGIKKGEAAST